MKDSSIVLSISMLISGKKDMGKSLESLRCFKETIPCEIILVDTGCNAEQRVLAEGYADKVIDFLWCGDFAAARNVGLQAARGEWFMYLDDDEWFDDPQEIIAFFKTGEYKNYNCASYTVRNYLNLQGTMYDDSYPSRMVKLEPCTRFSGKIHEYLEPFKLPKKTFSDFVHHYGYVYKNEEDKKKHAERNIEPLIEMCKAYPGEPRWICQLAQEYFAVGEYDKTIEICKTGLAEWKEREAHMNYAPSHVGGVYSYILISLETLERFEEEEYWLKKAFEELMNGLNYMEPTVAFYCLVAARLYSKTQKYELCREYFRRYIDYTKRLKDNREIVEAGAALIVAGVFQEQLLYGTVLMCMESAIRMEDVVLCEEAFELMDWSDRRLLHQVKWERNMLNAFCSVNYHPLWVKLLQILVSREDGMKEMYVIFLETELNYKRHDDKERLLRFRRLVSELGYEHRYILCSRILWTEQNPDISSDEMRKQKVRELFKGLFDKYVDELFEVKAEVWNVAQDMDISIEPLLLEVKYSHWKELLEKWAASAELFDLQQWDKQIAAWKQRGDIRYSLFAVKCTEGYLRHYRETCPSLSQMEQILWNYADKVLELNGCLYKEFVFREMPEMLPEEAQLALRLKTVQECREQGDARGALKNIRMCLGIYPALENVINAYAKMYRDEAQRRNQEAEREKDELALLVNSLKDMAKLQIQNRKYQSAREILFQVQQCMPEDTEVKELLEQLQQER